MIREYMTRALELAQSAADAGEVPVGAVVVCNGGVIGTAYNRVEEMKNACAHAELLALQAAMREIGDKYLSNASIYVTLEPCAMCAQAIAHARVAQVIFGAYDPKSGGVEHGARVFDHDTCHHKPEVIGGVCEKEANHLLKQFFQELR